MKSEFEVVENMVRFLPRGHLGKMLFGLLGMTIVTLFGSSRAHADCTAVATLPVTVVTFPATISVPPNAQANTVLATVTVPVNGATAGTRYANCTSSGTLWWQIASGGNVTNRVGSTTVAGVGYTATLSGGGLPNMSIDSSTNAASVAGGLASPTFSSQLNLTVNLVTTGAAIQPGPLSLNPSGMGTAGRVGIFYAGGNASVVFTATMPSNTTTITSAACSVTTPSSSVKLDPVKASSFSGVGSTAGSAPIPLAVNCPNTTSKVFVTLTDNVSPTNVSSTLSTKSDSTASGVKLQILDPQGNPVSFGPDSAQAGNTNQWLAGQAVSGHMSIPLTVRYVQTAATITPGTVNSVATFTMSYQ
ncbi:fimbrial protein [Achromobacter seleniivolatilans]|uniref:Fimbrial protein n=1 Tax=Achromobacter seleniivolatilans TaxID=3047478 RepID=A0ABY9M7D9_9BURK|nr:fimbrial protein [Achromobacter sp. R39]WMD22942.1 fimbrial protein [Achromobacter sp. R39]